MNDAHVCLVVNCSKCNNGFQRNPPVYLHECQHPTGVEQENGTINCKDCGDFLAWPRKQTKTEPIRLDFGDEIDRLKKMFQADQSKLVSEAFAKGVKSAESRVCREAIAFFNDQIGNFKISPIECAEILEKEFKRKGYIK